MFAVLPRLSQPCLFHELNRLRAREILKYSSSGPYSIKHCDNKSSPYCFLSTISTFNNINKTLLNSNGSGIVRASVRAQSELSINKKTYVCDDFTNVTPKILSHLNRNLYVQQRHPLCLVKQKIVNYMHDNYRSKYHTPRFAVVEQLDPVVTLKDNFDSLLVPADHVSRARSDSYYINRDYMLRAHTSAHQSNLIKMGLDHFLVVGDVYRRDEIDRSHYPVFHQMEGVNLIDNVMLDKVTSTGGGGTPGHGGIKMFESNGERNKEKQAVHTRDIVQFCEADLKHCLFGMAKALFGANIEYRWVDCYFPFTHPSWELEVMFNGEWMEVLGCGIMEQQILHEAGITDKVGWAFRPRPERLAMVLYGIPDIRTFWSQDSGFLHQFKNATPDSVVRFREVSKKPPCTNDLSFWLPGGGEEEDGGYNSNDFYDLVRDIGGHNVEQVNLIDDFVNKKTGRRSHSYRIVYRHMDKVLTNEEVNVIHEQIRTGAAEKLGVTLR
uniref:Phenylalanine--tRNA ligase, mitochondrial n=1 Tax=Acartia pacifica TaxID=335913 RepID=A0A0U2US88_ACAPC|nr:phenylalanine-tRNA mitochondrial-like isoform X1 [Acartia pacifica]